MYRTGTFRMEQGTMSSPIKRTSCPWHSGKKSQVNTKMLMTVIITISTSHPAGPLLGSIVVKIPRLCLQDTWVQILAPSFAGYETTAKLITFQASVFSSVKWEWYHLQTLPVMITSRASIIESPQQREPVIIIRVEFYFFQNFFNVYFWGERDREEDRGSEADSVLTADSLMQYSNSRTVRS